MLSKLIRREMEGSKDSPQDKVKKEGNIPDKGSKVSFSRGINPRDMMDGLTSGSKRPWSTEETDEGDIQHDIHSIEDTYNKVRQRREELKGLFSTSIEEIRRKKGGGDFYPSLRLLNLSRAISGDIPSKRSAYLRTVFSDKQEEYLEDFLIEHSINIAILSHVVGDGMGINGLNLQNLFISGLFHDLGMFRLDKRIIDKPSSLGIHEKKFITVHPIEGSKLFEKAFKDGDGGNSEATSLISRVILEEHERADGSGYPYQLKREEIHNFSMIIGVCDTIESLTHPRPYRDHIPCFMAFRRLTMDHKPTRLFGQNIFEACLKYITPYPPGIRVMLNNGMDAIVVESDHERPLNPVIYILGEDNKDSLPRIIDLKRNKVLNMINWKRKNKP